MKTYEGLLLGFFETGTEGILWALQQSYKNEHWDYEDLIILQDGDYLDIIDKESNIIWSGEVKLEYAEQFNGYYVHSLPLNFDHKEWWNIFIGEKHTGRLTRKEQ